MSDDPKQPERVWDEYDWERFLRKQDKRTELYLELLDRTNVPIATRNTVAVAFTY